MSSPAHFDSEIISQIDEAQSSRVPTHLPDDLYSLLVVPSRVPPSNDLHLKAGQAHTPATIDTKSEPEETPSKIEEFQSLVPRAPHTDGEFEASVSSDTWTISSHSSASSDSTTQLSPDRPLTWTSPPELYLAFRKRYRSSYETPSPSPSPTLLVQKRYRGTFELILDMETEDDESEAEGSGSGSEESGEESSDLEEEEAAPEGQQQPQNINHSNTATVTPSNPTIKPPSSTTAFHRTTTNLPHFNLPITTPKPHRTLHITNVLSNPKTTVTTTVQPPKNTHYVSHYADDQPGKGSDVLVESLEREGVTDVFAYPGGASMEIHQALTRSHIIRNVLPRHEQGGVFAAEGYAHAFGKPGVCITTSGPGATNLVSGLADALLDSVPLIAITGQVPRRMIGTDAFQETPIVKVTRSITKHNYLVLDVDDIPRVVKEAFYLARTGRPGPILIDVPKDIQQQLVVPKWDEPMRLPGYLARMPKTPNDDHLCQIVRLVSEAKKPVLYTGGGCLDASEELRRFVEMLGMHGTVYANYAVGKSELLLAFGVRFDDRVTRKLEAFASRAKIVHIDIDSAEIGKNKQPHVSICGDIKIALQGLNKILEKGEGKGLDFSSWRSELDEQKVKFPLSFKTFGLFRSRQWLTSGGLGAMRFGLPTAIGAAVARPDAVVVDIDGDGSFMMNVQELATIRVENLPVKILLLNNQHLDMLKFAEACDILAARVTKKADLRAAIQKMLDTPGPYLLDVIVPHQEHVLPMIPAGGGFMDVITEGDGRTQY
nr:acetolactate synthase 1 [Tanacetum cinerariifolium]